MSVIWFLFALYSAHVADLLIHGRLTQSGPKRLQPVKNVLRKVAILPADTADWMIVLLIFALIVSAVTAFRLLGSVLWGFDWGLFLGLVTYGGFVVASEPKGQAFLKKRFGKAWTKIRKRLGLPERIFLTEEEKVLHGLEAGLLAQIGESPLLAPIAANVRLLVHVGAPRLLEQCASISLGLARVRDNLHATREEPGSEERTRNLGIETRLCMKLEAKQALLDQMRHRLVHLVPVIEDVRIDLESGDGSDVQNALRYLDDLTDAIRTSVAEDVPALEDVSSP